MSISRLPSGNYRAQVWDPAANRNVSVSLVIGGPGTYPTREEAERAREQARAVVHADPAYRDKLQAATQEAFDEHLRRRQAEAVERRAAIRAKRDRWLAEGYEVDPATGCWNWQGVKDSRGYGQVRREGRAGGKQQAHRWFFEQLVGPIPDGLDLDHLCCNRACVNPDHIDPVTPTENVRRALDMKRVRALGVKVPGPPPDGADA